MATIRSNLNSVSNTSNLAAFRTRLNTCLQNWRSKPISLQQKEHNHYFYWHRQRYQRNSPVLQKLKEYPLKEKTSECLKEFREKLQKLFSSRKVERVEKAEEVQIVAKLLSTSLIVASSLKETQQDYSCSNETNFNMTIVENDLLVVRDEYPELEDEVKSILVARAQEGATISEIREDYVKHTGMPLPLYENITAFLLSIPSVSAVCTDRGTLIFNIKPSSKNKHIHDMVLNQKPSTNLKRIYEDRNKPDPHFWRNNLNYQIQSKKLINYNENNFFSKDQSWEKNKENLLENYPSRESSSQSSHQIYKKSKVLREEEVFKKPLDVRGENRLRDSDEQSKYSSEVASAPFTENNWFYQDNVNYLQNRLQNHDICPAYYNHNVIDANCIIDHHRSSELHSDYLYSSSSQGNRQQNKQINFRRATTPFPPRRLTSSPVNSKSTPTNESYQTSLCDFEAHFLDFPLLGDDFLMYFARMEFKCKFRTDHGILQSGLCASGQTIREAIQRIRWLPYRLGKRVIVNIGSVDVMQGRSLIKIEHDFKKLLAAMTERGLVPILTTLAPLANFAHEPEIKNTLKRFNDFIKRQSSQYMVIDVWSIFVSESGRTLFGCYQHETRSVTGAKESYVFWNKIGRQRVLKLIESKLEY